MGLKETTKLTYLTKKTYKLTSNQEQISNILGKYNNNSIDHNDLLDQTRSQRL